MKITVCIVATLFAAALFAQEAPTGSIATITGQEKRQLASLKGSPEGIITWSSSRSNSKHDIWIMNADGTNAHQLTQGDRVDWYPRISPDGGTVLFIRSKSGWVPEGDAEIFDKWDLWTVETDGTGEKRVAESGCWGAWRPSGDSIVFARGSEVFIKSLATGKEKVVFNAEEAFKKGAYAQQPQLSPDGNNLAMTVRGSHRETGIWNIPSKTWHSTGAGCQMEWFPSGRKILRMNEGQGNGGTEVLSIDIDENGAPLDKISGLSIPKKIRFMDLPGRRSHEYFPKTDQTGTWLVWCATQYGHEHDLADYELYLWKIGSDKKNGMVRLTFHTGNDRWPDIFTGKPVAHPAPPKEASPAPPAPVPDTAAAAAVTSNTTSSNAPADSSRAPTNQLQQP